MIVFERDIYMKLLADSINKESGSNTTSWTDEDKEFALKVMEQRKNRDG